MKKQSTYSIIRAFLLAMSLVTAGCEGLISGYVDIGETTSLSIETGTSVSSLTKNSKLSTPNVGDETEVFLIRRDLNGNYVETVDAEWSIDNSSLVNLDWKNRSDKSCKLSGLELGTTTLTATIDGRTATKTLTLDTRSKLVIGQNSSSDIVQYRRGLYYPYRAIRIGSKFAVADGSRILIYNSMPSSGLSTPDIVLGQKSENTNSPNATGLNEYGINYACDVSTDGTRIIVSDCDNNRILIWNTIPTTNFTPADVVLGQPDFNSNTENNGGISASTMNYPTGATSDGTRLFVADMANNRILVWNAIPTTNGTAADLVLGQPDMVSNSANNGGLSAQSLNVPYSVWSDGTRVVTGDYSNHRVLIWNTIPTINQQAADVVLGQPDMTSNASNNGGISASTLSSPFFGIYNGSKFAVADYGNHRMLIWNSIPTTNQQAADLVLGQPDMNSNTANNGGVSSQSMYYPWGFDFTATELIVSDYSNHRVLVWDSIPTTDQQAPDRIIGQADGSTNSAFANPISINPYSLSYPNNVAVNGKKIAVTDSRNNRVLIWNSIPKDFNDPPDIVLGQPDLNSTTANNGGIGANTLNYPLGLNWDGSKFMVTDYYNHRVLIWNSFPSTTQQPADLVLGQPDFTSNARDNGGVSAQSMDYPSNLFSDGTRLFVVDQSNHRVLVWNTFPTVDRQPADLVLGQPNMTSSSNNNGGLSSQSFSYPWGVYSTGSKLVVADTWNNRILIWNSIPTINQQAADVVIGQPDFVSNTENNGGVSAQSVANPNNVFVSSGKLYVADSSNNRILRWDTMPTVNQTAADAVLGQSNMTSNGSNKSENIVDADGFSYPTSILYSEGLSFINDLELHRVIINRNPTF